MATSSRLKAKNQTYYPGANNRLRSLLNVNLFSGQWSIILAFFLIIPSALALGILIGRMGFLVLPAAILGIALFMMLRFGRQLFGWYIVFLLIGYLFGGRGFAYVGFFPVFVGEIGLVLGIGCLFLLPFTNKISISFNWITPSVIVLLIFMGVQVIATIPYVGTYQLDSLRDAMMYLYALMALLIGLLIPRDWVRGFFQRWQLIVATFIFLVPVLYFFSAVRPFPIRFPGAPVPLIGVKYGDIGVHLAGAAAYLLLHLDREHRPFKEWFTWTMWVAWAVGWVVFGASNRAGMLSAVTGVSLTLLLWPISGWHRPFLMAIFGVSLLVSTGAYTDLSVDAGKGRQISAQQVVDNFVSIFADNGNEGGLQGTKEWRINWWTDIWNYTFNGPYFWTGKGYGVNLAVSDGYTVAHASEKLRAPHNSHFNFLARSGVPGFLLWITFLVTFYGHLIFVVFRYRTTNPVHAKYAVWITVYSFAFLVNGSFDLVLESPFAAIWFWVLVGFGFKYFGSPPEPKTTQSMRLKAETQ